MSKNSQGFEAIRDTLLAFQSHDIRLADLVEEVPSVLKNLQTEQEWKDQFVSYWWTLEQIHEEAIEVGESRRLPPERRHSVDVAINGMIGLVDQMMQVDITEANQPS
jgi:hypothetical protein